MGPQGATSSGGLPVELGRSAQAGGATHTLAPAGVQCKPHADWGGRQVEHSIAHTSGQQAPAYAHARRVGFSELLGSLLFGEVGWDDRVLGRVHLTIMKPNRIPESAFAGRSELLSNALTRDIALCDKDPDPLQV